MPHVHDSPGRQPGHRSPATPTARRRTGSRFAFLRRWVSPIAIIAIWQLLCMGGFIDPRTMASPSDIARTAVELIKDGTLGAETLVSLQRVVLGLVIGGFIGLSLAIVAGLSRIGEDAIDPPMQMLRTLPHFGLISLFITWFGLGETPKVTLIAMGACFPLYLNTLGGIRGIDRKMLEAARSMHLDPAPADPARRHPGRTPADPDRPAAEPRHRLAVAHRRGDHPDRRRARPHDQRRPRVPADRRHRRRPRRLRRRSACTTDAIVRYLERRALAWRA